MKSVSVEALSTWSDLRGLRIILGVSVGLVSSGDFSSSSAFVRSLFILFSASTSRSREYSNDVLIELLRRDLDDSSSSILGISYTLAGMPFSSVANSLSSAGVSFP